MLFEERYRAGDTPWEIHRPDKNLMQMVTDTPIKPCKAVDIGCGSGNNAIWLAEQGFEVIGCDSSENATGKAMEKAAKADVACSFYSMDFLRDKIPGVPFDFAFDRGCFHHFDDKEQREQFAGKVAEILEDGGIWLSLIGNADDLREDPGPPQRTASEIILAIEPYFEILSLISGHFDSNRKAPPRNWICLMKKRRDSFVK